MTNPRSAEHARELMFGYLDETLNAEQVAELNEILKMTPALRTEFAQLLRTEVHLRELRERRRARAAASAERRRLTWHWLDELWKWPRPAWAGLGAAAALIIVAIYWFGPRGSVPLRAEVESITGTATVQRSGRVTPLTARFQLAPGDRVRSEPKAMVQIAWEGASITISNGADLTLERSQSLRVISVQAGQLRTALSSTAAAGPLRVHSPAADATAEKAEFTVVAAPEAMRVEVKSGTVHVTRLSDAATTEVVAGEFTVAQPGAPLVVYRLNPNDDRIISGGGQPKP